MFSSSGPNNPFILSQKPVLFTTKPYVSVSGDSHQTKAELYRGQRNEQTRCSMESSPAACGTEHRLCKLIKCGLRKAAAPDLRHGGKSRHHRTDSEPRRPLDLLIKARSTLNSSEVAQGSVLQGLGNFRGWRLHNLSGQGLLSWGNMVS